MRGTSQLLDVVIYGAGCGGGGRCVGTGRYVCRSYHQQLYGPREAGHVTAIGDGLRKVSFLYTYKYTPPTLLVPTAVWPAQCGARHGYGSL